MTSESSEQDNSLKKILKRIIKSPKEESSILEHSQYEELDIHRKDMIQGILVLSEKNARDIMIPRIDIIAIDHKIKLKPLAKLVYEAGHSRLPVFEDTIDNIKGILYAKDLLKKLIDSSQRFTLNKILHDGYFVPETMPLDELLREFKKRKLHLAIVVDEYGGVSGIVTMEDILEEIVGEIEDEFDVDTIPECIKLSKYSYDIDPRMTILDFNKELEQNISIEDFDTIGGYVFDLFGKIPEKDESIKKDGITYKIKEINGTVISRLSITLPRNK